MLLGKWPDLDLLSHACLKWVVNTVLIIVYHPLKKEASVEVMKLRSQCVRYETVVRKRAQNLVDHGHNASKATGLPLIRDTIKTNVLLKYSH